MFFYWILFHCTNRFQQALHFFYVILNLFCASVIQMKLTCVWCIFRFIFKLVLPLPFLTLWLPLLLNMENNEKNYEGAESKEKRKNKKIVLNSKKEFARVYSFITSARKSKVWTSTPSSPLSTNIQFWSNHTPLLDVLNWHSTTSHTQTHTHTHNTLGNFGIFLKNFNNEVNIVKYSFFFANAHSIYYSHILLPRLRALHPYKGN